MTKESDYIAYLETQSELQADRIAELEACLAVMLIRYGLKIPEEIMIKIIAINRKSEPRSALMLQKFREIYGQAKI